MYSCPVRMRKKAVTDITVYESLPCQKEKKEVEQQGKGGRLRG